MSKIFTELPSKEKTLVYSKILLENYNVVNHIKNTLSFVAVEELKISSGQIMDLLLEELFFNVTPFVIDNKMMSSREIVIYGLNLKLQNTKKFLAEQNNLEQIKNNLWEIKIKKEKISEYIEYVSRQELKKKDKIIRHQKIQLEKLEKLEASLLNEYLKNNIDVILEEIKPNKSYSATEFKQFKYKVFMEVNEKGIYNYLLDILEENLDDLIQNFNEYKEDTKYVPSDEELSYYQIDEKFMDDKDSFDEMLGKELFESSLNKIRKVYNKVNCLEANVGYMQEDLDYFKQICLETIYEDLVKTKFLISDIHSQNDLLLAKSIGVTNLQEFKESSAMLKEELQQKLDQLFDHICNFLTSQGRLSY